MQLQNNRVIIACAGSGKTTRLIDEALSKPDKSIAILTYTINNTNEIKRKFGEKYGGIPQQVDVLTWFAFVLRECARPYQRCVYQKHRIETINFPEGRSPYYPPFSDKDRYYFIDGYNIYADKISRFALECDERSDHLVIKRLEQIYDEIFIDECQDLSGWDLDLLKALLQSRIRMTVVGDPRQCTYTTNNALKNHQYRGMGILKLVREWEANGLCQRVDCTDNHRSNQKICDFADTLWPAMEKTQSHSDRATEHDGVFVVSEGDVHEYVRRFSPCLLRYDKRTSTHGYHALNFGVVKGLEFDRVLVIPHGPMKKYLQTGKLDHVQDSLEKFYVAVTRAKQSVAFLYNGACATVHTRWQP